jgi:formylmethanofuran--tetrahydromethanopterin N-formyltransferase
MLGADQARTLAAAEAAVAAIREVDGVILPFPGGLVRSGSKVGSRYKTLKASTNDEYCPTLRAITRSRLPEGINAVYEIVIDGLEVDNVRRAMRMGIRAACRDGIRVISAGNYEGKLGQHQLRLHDVVGEEG